MARYGNKYVTLRSRARTAKKTVAIRKSLPPREGVYRSRTGKGPESKQWTREFAAWVARRARIGETFLARTPMNP